MPAYGLNDAPANVRRSSKKRLLDSKTSLRRVRLRRQTSTFDQRLFLFYRATDGAAGAFATYIDNIFGRGELDVLPKIRTFLEQRFGELKLQESSYGHVGWNQNRIPRFWKNIYSG